MTARQIDKEVQQQAVLFEEKCLSGQVLDKFADFTKIWLQDYAEKRLRRTTLARYKSLMPRVNVAIGHLRLEKIQPHHLMAFYDNLAEDNVRGDVTYKCIVDLNALLNTQHLTRRTLAPLAGVSVTTLDCAARGDGVSKKSATLICSALNTPINKVFAPSGDKTKLSTTTVLHHHRLISSILTQAVKWQIIFSNPCSRVITPRKQKQEAIYLDENEAAQMLELLEKESVQNRVIIKLLLFTGLRRGELCGLEWNDVDFNNSILHIKRSSLYLPGKVDETKNETSQRSLKVSAAAIDSLKEQRAWQQRQRLALGDQWQTSNRVFTTSFGAPIRPDSITGWFKRFVNKNGLPPVHVHRV